MDVGSSYLFLIDDVEHGWYTIVTLMSFIRLF